VTNSNPVQPTIGVVGLWHLGCTIAACWAKLGHTVRAVEFDETAIRHLQVGRAPIYEPQLEETLREASAEGRLSYSASPQVLSDCRFVFVSYDTPVRDDDTADPSVIEAALQRIGPYLDPRAIVIVSAQLPAGMAQQLRVYLKQFHKTLELAYSPENLRLGQALACYMKPGHIVIGADDTATGAAVAQLFAPMQATCLKMNLTSAEMTKHAINSFLAASITQANQWAELCEAVGADIHQVIHAIKYDPRIGQQAYLAPGIGFSGGTLGRDLQVLERLNRERANGRAPIFGEIWRYNRSRITVVRHRCEQQFGKVRGITLALLGMTYKPGTSTLRRSLPVEIAADLARHGASVSVFDPRADWTETAPPSGVCVSDSPYAAASQADMLIVLTEWPEFLSLDYDRLKRLMVRPIIFDTKDCIKSLRPMLEALGFQILTIGRSERVHQ